MARPKKGSWKKIKRLGRYLLQYPRLIWQFEDADVGAIEYVDVFSDSDWAGDKVERKSTSGGVAMIAGGVIKTWSSTQGTLSLSVGEAEYYALIKAAAEGLGIQSLAKDMGYDLKVRIWVDSTTETHGSEVFVGYAGDEESEVRSPKSPREIKTMQTSGPSRRVRRR